MTEYSTEQIEGLERYFGFLVHDVARLMRVEYDRRVKPYGITRSQWWVLAHLHKQDGVTQSELADVLEVGGVTLCRLLDRLEERELIERRSDPKDRRAKRVYMTTRSNREMAGMIDTGHDLNQEVLVHLTLEQREQFIDMLWGVKKNLQQLDQEFRQGKRKSA
jgi:MarR family transcriptional regulator, transcriptional regulator for hemolysin